jgi:hypothetical protein
MLPLSADELHEVTAEIGFAVWRTQILENTVGDYLVFAHKITPTVAKSEVESMFAKAGKSTLGQLLREIQAIGNVPQHVIEELDSFVSERNWLIHHSRHETHTDMHFATLRAALMTGGAVESKRRTDSRG